MIIEIQGEAFQGWGGGGGGGGRECKNPKWYTTQ